MTTATTLRKYQDIIEGKLPPGLQAHIDAKSESKEEEVEESTEEEVEESRHFSLSQVNNAPILRKYQDILLEADPPKQDFRKQAGLRAGSMSLAQRIKIMKDTEAEYKRLGLDKGDDPLGGWWDTRGMSDDEVQAAKMKRIDDFYSKQQMDDLVSGREGEGEAEAMADKLGVPRFEVIRGEDGDEVKGDPIPDEVWKKQLAAREAEDTEAHRKKMAQFDIDQWGEFGKPKGWTPEKSQANALASRQKDAEWKKEREATALASLNITSDGSIPADTAGSNVAGDEDEADYARDAANDAAQDQAAGKRLDQESSVNNKAAQNQATKNRLDRESATVANSLKTQQPVAEPKPVAEPTRTAQEWTGLPANDQPVSGMNTNIGVWPNQKTNTTDASAMATHAKQEPKVKTMAKPVRKYSGDPLLNPRYKIGKQT